MDAFEAKLAQATTKEPLGLLGAIGLVVDSNVLHHHAAGAARLDSDDPVKLNSTVMLASAGKFITHIAALQLVQRGLVDLDSPVWPHLPELQALPVLEGNGITTPPKTAITPQSLLLHTSGLSDPESPLLEKFPQVVNAFCTGGPLTVLPSVNWSMAGLTAESTLPASQLPKGTVVWEGMPNVMWAMNREKGLATFSATQLLPIAGEQANAVALEFMSSAWSTFSRDTT